MAHRHLSEHLWNISSLLSPLCWWGIIWTCHSEMFLMFFLPSYLLLIRGFSFNGVQSRHLVRATGLGTTGDSSHSLCIPLSVSLEKIRKMSCGFSERRFVIFHSWDQSWLERSCMKSQLKSSNKTIHFSLTHWRNDSLIVKPAVSEWWLWGKYNNKMVMDHWYANNVIH